MDKVDESLHNQWERKEAEYKKILASKVENEIFLIGRQEDYCYDKQIRLSSLETKLKEILTPPPKKKRRENQKVL